MVLENCAEPQLGCCILLRGASLPELAKVKRVAKFMLLACYNWKHEKSFLNDIDAILPEPGMTFGDDEDSNDAKGDGDDGKSDGNDKSIQRNDESQVKTGGNDELIVRNDESAVKTDDVGAIESVSTSKVTEVTKSNEMPNSSITKPENDDPLQNAKFVRKTDSERNLSSVVPIRDFSDPLRASQISMDDDVFCPREETKLKADSQNDR